MSVLGKRNRNSLENDEPQAKIQRLSDNNTNNNNNNNNTDEDDDLAIQCYSSKLNEPLILNVGGIRYSTTLQTLTGYNSMLKARFSSKYAIKASSDGTYFIDRNGELFKYILEYLRTGILILPLNWNKSDIWKFYIEIKYYAITSLFNNVLFALFNSKLITNNSLKLKIVNKMINVLNVDNDSNFEWLNDITLIYEYNTFKMGRKYLGDLNACTRISTELTKVKALQYSTKHSLLLIECNGRIYGLFLTMLLKNTDCHKYYLYNESFAFDCGDNSANYRDNDIIDNITFECVRHATDEETKIDDDTLHALYNTVYPIIIRRYKDKYISCGDLELKAKGFGWDEWEEIIKMELWSIPSLK